jgi:ferredoxin
MGDAVVRFRDERFKPVRVVLRQHLSEQLDAGNSPLLFGCRTGICGTCLVRVRGEVPAPSDDERELLEVLAPGDPEARLACQLYALSDLEVEPHPG